MAITESLISALKEHSLLMASLHGVRTYLEKELELKNLLIATDDTITAELKRKGLTGYPYSYLVVNDMMGVRDETHTRTVQRLGISTGMDESLRATSGRGFIFPLNVGIELKYVDDDPVRLVLMAESLAILSMIGGLTFSLSVGSFEWNVRIEVPESTAIPLGSAESTNAPGASEVSVNLILHTRSGFFRDVSAMQNAVTSTVAIQQQQ